MKILGGKSQLATQISQIVRRLRLPSQSFLEPFCGAAWITVHLYPGPTTASDISAPLICLHQAVQKGWEPPDFISEDMYSILQRASRDGETSPFITFAGYSCSWSGKWWGGYARGNSRNYCLEAKKSLLQKHTSLKNVLFEHANYKNLEPKNLCIYCDPPYANTTSYDTPWNPKEFWEIMRRWSKNNTVIISEYKAPADFKCIWRHNHFSFKATDSRSTVERLFKYEP